jgi:putative addiction module component (TIGR02574 family)
MNSTLDPLKAQLSNLSAAERADLAHFLIVSLDEVSDPDAAELWDKEIQKRVAEIKRGEVQPVAAEQVFRELRERHTS